MNRDATIFSTIHNDDGTARRVEMRIGDAPSEEDWALSDAIRIADSRPEGADPRRHFEHICGAAGAFRLLVLSAYRGEILIRTHNVWTKDGEE